MKKLLLNSFLFIIVISVTSCSNIRNKAVTTNKNNSEAKSTITDTITTRNAVLMKGDSISSNSSNTKSSEKGSHYKKFEVKHNAPNQAEIDSIKREKTKRKK